MGVRWGEFVSAAYLSFLRDDRQVSIQHMRLALAGLRSRHPEVRYPLAHFQPLTTDGTLLADDDGAVELASTGQLLIPAVVDRFANAVVWERDIARRLRPDPENHRVIVDPLQSFGIPTAGGIRTEILWELFQTGESMADIGGLYDLDLADVEDAIRFESARGEALVER